MQYPLIALPNIRSDNDNNGAHIVNKLIGKKTGNGSIYLLKYPNLFSLAAVKWIKTNVIRPKDNVTPKYVTGEASPVKPKINDKNT